MMIRERLKALLHRFERALTRVEDQGVRVEQGVDNVIEQLKLLNELCYTLRSDVLDRDSKREAELLQVKQGLAVLQKKLEQPSKPH